MAFNPQLARTLRAVSHSLRESGIGTQPISDAVDAACNGEAQHAISVYASRMLDHAKDYAGRTMLQLTLPGIDDAPIPTETGRAVRSPRKHAEQNGMVSDPNAYP